MKNKNKVNIPLLLAGILFCLTLISISLTSNLIAKYSTTASGSDSARVAKFDVGTTTNSQPDKIELVPGDSDSSGTYKFTIKIQHPKIKYVLLPPIKKTYICGKVQKNRIFFLQNLFTITDYCS